MVGQAHSEQSMKTKITVTYKKIKQFAAVVEYFSSSLDVPIMCELRKVARVKLY